MKRSPKNVKLCKTIIIARFIDAEVGNASAPFQAI